MAVYEEGEVTCNRFGGRTVFHYLVINEACFPDNAEDVVFWNDEYFFECFPATLRDAGSRFACTEWVNIPVKEGGSGTIVMANVSTDPYRWNAEAFGECYNGITSASLSSTEVGMESIMSAMNKTNNTMTVSNLDEQDDGSTSGGHHVKAFHVAISLVGMVMTWLYSF